MNSEHALSEADPIGRPRGIRLAAPTGIRFAAPWGSDWVPPGWIRYGGLWHLFGNCGIPGYTLGCRPAADTRDRLFARLRVLLQKVTDVGEGRAGAKPLFGGGPHGSDRWYGRFRRAFFLHRRQLLRHGRSPCGEGARFMPLNKQALPVESDEKSDGGSTPSSTASSGSASDGMPSSPQLASEKLLFSEVRGRDKTEGCMP